MLRVILIVFIFASCHPVAVKDSYHAQYRHLERKRETLHQEKPFLNNDNFLVLLVDAKHLDYTDVNGMLSTIAKHPDGSAEQDVGHAWIVLSGIKNGKRIVIEGGHSGERGTLQPRYLEGIFYNQTTAPNPIQYLFTSLQDGYFEAGPGRHKPTYAIRLELDEKTFLQLYELIQPERYHFTEYSLIQNQCSTFVAKVASLAGLDLEQEVQVKIPQFITFDSKQFQLWQDPRFAAIQFASPDILEKSMIEAVEQGKAKVAVNWYRTEWPKLKTQ